MGESATWRSSSSSKTKHISSGSRSSTAVAARVRPITTLASALSPRTRTSTTPQSTGSSSVSPTRTSPVRLCPPRLLETSATPQPTHTNSSVTASHPVSPTTPLNKYGLDTAFPGQEEIDGEFEEDFIHNEQDEDGPAAFHALLDVGLKCATLGSKLFAAMKGAFDGGLEIPHSEKKFFGYDPDGKEYDAAEHRDRIFGGHVRDYMESMEADDPDKYATHFSAFIAADIGCDDLEELYKKVHTSIKEDPTAKPI